MPAKNTRAVRARRRWAEEGAAPAGPAGAGVAGAEEDGAVGGVAVTGSQCTGPAPGGRPRGRPRPAAGLSYPWGASRRRRFPAATAATRSRSTCSPAWGGPVRAAVRRRPPSPPSVPAGRRTVPSGAAPADPSATGKVAVDVVPAATAVPARRARAGEQTARRPAPHGVGRHPQPEGRPLDVEVHAASRIRGDRQVRSGSGSPACQER